MSKLITRTLISYPLYWVAVFTVIQGWNTQSILVVMGLAAFGCTLAFQLGVGSKEK